MNFSKIFIKDANPTKMGGQAVMEGIMMKGADRMAVAIRRADSSINVKETPLPEKKEWMKWPVMRGILAFVDSLVTGMKTLMYSGSVVEEDIEDDEEDYEPGKLETKLLEKFGEKGLFQFMLYASVVVALVISIGVFVLLPTWIVGLCKAFTSSSVLLNLIEGVLRIAMFIVYVAAIAQMPDIKRVFQYHGAEHQTIHCYENGLELTPENCAQFETLHPRCGTSFIMFVFIISLLLFSFLGWPNIAVRLLSRLLLIPVVAGLSYELLRWAGSSDSSFVKAMSVPGLLMQKLTTKVPDESMLEVAIVAVKTCLRDEPPQERIFDTDSYGNEIDRAKWQVACDVCEGEISPEGAQRASSAKRMNEWRRAELERKETEKQMTGAQKQEAGNGVPPNRVTPDLTDADAEQISPEASQETVAFAQLLRELEIPDPPQKSEQEMEASAAQQAESVEQAETAPTPQTTPAQEQAQQAAPAAPMQEQAESAAPQNETKPAEQETKPAAPAVPAAQAQQAAPAAQAKDDPTQTENGAAEQRK